MTRVHNAFFVFVNITIATLIKSNCHSGFIDFIVSPTLAVCGDMVAAVLGEEAEVRKKFSI